MQSVEYYPNVSLHQPLLHTVLPQLCSYITSNRQKSITQPFMHHHPPMLFFSKAQVDYSFGWNAECRPQKDKNVNIRLFREGRQPDKRKACNKVIQEEVWTRRRPPKSTHFVLAETCRLAEKPVLNTRVCFEADPLYLMQISGPLDITGDEHMYIYCFLSLMNCTHFCRTPGSFGGFSTSRCPSCRCLTTGCSFLPAWEKFNSRLGYNH